MLHAFTREALFFCTFSLWVILKFPALLSSFSRKGMTIFINSYFVFVKMEFFYFCLSLRLEYCSWNLHNSDFFLRWCISISHIPHINFWFLFDIDNYLRTSRITLTFHYQWFGVLYILYYPGWMIFNWTPLKWIRCIASYLFFCTFLFTSLPSLLVYALRSRLPFSKHKIFFCCYC